MAHNSINFLSQLFNKTPEVIEQAINKFLMIKYAPDKTIINNIKVIESYLSNNKLLEQDNKYKIMDFAYNNLNLLAYKPDNLKKIFGYYKKTFQLTANEFYKLRKSKIFNISPETCENIIGYFQQKFDIKRNDVLKIITNNFSILTYGYTEDNKCYSKQSIQQRVERLQCYLGCDNQTLYKILKNYSRTVGYTDDLLYKKIENIKNIFNIDDKKAKCLLYNHFRIINESPEDLIQQVEYLQSLGFDKKFLLETPFLLTTQTQTLKAKYMLGRVFGVPVTNKDIFINNFYTSYAKLNLIGYLKQSKGIEMSISLLGWSEKTTKERTGFNMEELYKKYPLDESILLKLNIIYKNLTSENTNLPKLSLTDEEIKFLINQKPPKLIDIFNNNNVNYQQSCEQHLNENNTNIGGMVQ